MSKLLRSKSSRIGIGFKLITLLMVICIVPMTVLGLFSYNKTKGVVFDQFKVTSSQILDETNGELDKYFDGFERQIKMLSMNVNLTEIQMHPNYEPFLRYLLQNVKDSNKDVSLVYLGTSNKKLYDYPDIDEGAGFDPTQRPWYAAAIKNKGELVINKPYIDNVTKKLAVTISKTVENNGTIIGVVAMDLDLDMLSENLSRIKLGKAGYVVVMDDKGVILGHPDKKMVGIDTPSKLSIWEDISKNNKGFDEYSDGGIKKYTAFLTNDISGWKMMAIMNESELGMYTRPISNAMIIGTIIAAVVAIGMALFISRWITGNIYKLKKVFSKASQGDLTVSIDVKSKDEFGELALGLNNMISNIGGLIKNVKLSAGTMNQTSETIIVMARQAGGAISEVAMAIDAIATGTLDQTKDIEDGVNELESLAGKIETIVELTDGMGRISRDTDSLSQQGLKIVDKLSQKAEETSRTVLEAGNFVYDMSVSTAEISVITEAINQISAQTNLLALNAAIEAARAGEAGRGFAVVADEVRKLAEQAAQSTRQIQELVEGISAKSHVAVEAVEKANSIVGEQNEVVAATGETFRSILESVQNLARGVDKVQSSIVETNSSKEEIIGKMHNISAVSEETSASTEEVSASSEEITATMDEFTNYAEGLKELSGKLQAEIEKFRLD